jgi:hypothetical protein
MNRDSLATPPQAPKREWTPRMWQGCDLFAWLRLLWRNHFAVGPQYFYMPCVITCVSAGHTVLRYIQEAWYGSKLDHTPIRHAPLFIIGHWRTGTTLLHEMLILDERHTSPNYYHCLEPNHFLLTEKVVKRFFRWMMPSHRPMDNMAVGWDRPQEDEFALCMLGQPSPYLTIAFPNHPPQDQEALDPECLPRRARAAWKKAFVGFLRRLTFHDPRRLVLKSPTHTCRIPTLLELFPGARFVHIVRDPFVVYPSTINLWRSLYETHGLQRPNFRHLEELVLSTFSYLYDRLELTRHLIPTGQFHELRYEDLIADPVRRMQQLYEALNLGGFERVRPRLERFSSEQSGYRTNRYPLLTDEQRLKIRSRWGKVIERFGYARSAAGAAE